MLKSKIPGFFLGSFNPLLYATQPPTPRRCGVRFWR